MFALRQINNNYADHAGNRGDFVVIGHPEFNLGKSGSVHGYGHGWDTTGVKTLPKRSPAADRLRSCGGVSRHVRHVAEVPTEPRQSLKARALARSKSSPLLFGGPGGSRSSAAQGSSAGFDAFVAEVSSPETLPHCSPNRTVAGFGNHLRSQPVYKHYSRVQEELLDLGARLRATPEATKVELLAEDSWKYYARHLEQARRNEAQLRRSKLHTMPLLQAQMASPGS